MRKKPDRWGLVPGQHDLWRYRPIVIPYWEGASAPRDYGHRRIVITKNGNVPWGITPGGRAVTMGGADQDYVDLGNPTALQFTDTTSFTILSVFTPTADATLRSLLRKDTTGNPRPVWLWRKTASDTMEFLFGDTGSTLGSITSTITLTTGQVYAAIAMRDVAADQLRLFFGGVKDAEVADASTGTWTISAGNVQSRDPRTQKEAWKGSKILDIIFPFNALTDNEARQLTLDPYMMLRQAPLNVGRVPDAVAGRIMSGLVGGGGLIGQGGIIGQSGGLAA